MPKLLTESQVKAYKRDGYVAPLRIMSLEQAETVRAKLEAVEAITLPHLRKGQFSPPDKLLNLLRSKP